VIDVENMQFRETRSGERLEELFVNLVAGFSDSVRLQPRQPHPLASGDRLRLGDTTLHFLMS